MSIKSVQETLKKSFEKDYPQLKGKKLVLYAPTFREDPKNNAVFDYFDIEKFLDELGDEYASNSYSNQDLYTYGYLQQHHQYGTYYTLFIGSMLNNHNNQENISFVYPFQIKHI